MLVAPSRFPHTEQGTHTSLPAACLQSRGRPLKTANPAHSRPESMAESSRGGRLVPHLLGTALAGKLGQSTGRGASQHARITTVHQCRASKPEQASREQRSPPASRRGLGCRLGAAGPEPPLPGLRQQAGISRRTNYDRTERTVHVPTGASLTRREPHQAASRSHPSLHVRCIGWASWHANHLPPSLPRRVAC